MFDTNSWRSTYARIADLEERRLVNLKERLVNDPRNREHCTLLRGPLLYLRTPKRRSYTLYNRLRTILVHHRNIIRDHCRVVMILTGIYLLHDPACGLRCHLVDSPGV